MSRNQAATHVPARTFLIYRHFALGGIETLMVRLANHLAGLGRRVTVCHEGGPSADYLAPEVDQIDYRSTADLVRQFADRAAGPGPILIVSFDPISAARALMLEVRFGARLSITHLTGIFHPRAYFYPGERFYRRLADRWLAAVMGKRSLVFMNEPCRATHADHWRWDLSDCPIVPLPLAEPEQRWSGGGSGAPLRIASVGRLVQFKNYNLGLIRVVRELRDSGLEVRWDVYGRGELWDAMAEQVRLLGLDRHVRMLGDLPYPAFGETVAGYDLFIGMGTAALEAAAIGVPTILATDCEERLSYGFLGEVDDDTVGERLAHDPPHDYAELIRRFAAMPAAERMDLSRRGREAMARYSLPHYVARLDAMMAAARPAPSAFRKRLVATLHHWMTDAPLTETARLGWYALRSRSR